MKVLLDDGYKKILEDSEGRRIYTTSKDPVGLTRNENPNHDEDEGDE